MGGWEGKQIVGQKNLEEFYSLIAPRSFRLTKAEAIDLPPKIYATREYEMGEASRRHYESLKNTFMTEMNNGSIVDVTNATTALLRLQQIVCGYLPVQVTDGETESTAIEIFSNERLDIMMDIIDQVEGPVIIWARFIADIQRIATMLDEKFKGKVSVTYYGATSTADREKARTEFLNGTKRFFVSNPAAGGTGLNLQGKCQTVIYYSNSFDALHRWQSEDRTHRMGTTGAVTYFDLVASFSVDKAILRSLKAKKSLSSLTLDEIRQAISNS
jgi:SNF2 family DNA or RNA helicase